MKKWLLVLLGFILSIGVNSCTRELPDYTIDEAFVLMNEAVSNYLNADSLSLEYTGNYVSTNYNNDESMIVRMKKMNSENLIGYVYMDILENETTFKSIVNYQQGMIYTERTQDGSTEYVKDTLAYTEYQSLYQSFLKKEINQASTRSPQILIDKDTLTVNFELASEKVEETFFVSTVLNTVHYAIVSMVLSHDAKLLSFTVEYEATINQILGTQTYSVSILKLDQYVVISQLSSSEIALYQQATTSE